MVPMDAKGVTTMTKNLEDWRHKAMEVSAIDFAAIQSEYMALIDANPREEDVQKYLESHCYLLLQASVMPML